MASNLKSTEINFLEKSRMAIQNAEHPQIAPLLDEFSIDAIERGKGLSHYTIARTAYDNNRIEHDEESAAYSDFDTAMNAVKSRYTKDKKRAKVAFKRDAQSKAKLRIDTSLPDAYLPRIDTIATFYKELASSPEMLAKMARLKFNETDLTDGQKAVEEVEAKRSAYLIERGEAQEATVEKDKALEALHFWMDDFLDVAELALEEHPQLMEIMGIVVPS